MTDAVDHVVPTVRAADRRALRFGAQRINLRLIGHQTRALARIGPADPRLRAGRPGTRSGAQGGAAPIYFNDPDGTLIEIRRGGDPRTE